MPWPPEIHHCSFSLLRSPEDWSSSLYQIVLDVLDAQFTHSLYFRTRTRPLYELFSVRRDLLSPASLIYNSTNSPLLLAPHSASLSTFYATVSFINLETYHYSLSFVIMAFNIVPPLRAVQFVFGMIVLALAGYGANSSTLSLYLH